LGGIGKTQLALYYLHHSKHPYTLKAWFPSENIAQLQQKYLEFAKALGYQEQNQKIDIIISYVNQWLSNHPGWLLIYDNVNSYEEIAPFLPEKGGHVIITTRNQIWPGNFNILSLDVMSESESIGLLTCLLQREMTKEETSEASELVKLLGYLPLAIAQAGSYIKQTQISIEKYLDLYKKYESTLLTDKTLPEGNNTLPVATTWNISLAKLLEEAKFQNQPDFEIKLLNMCAYLSPEKISRQFLLTWFKNEYSNLPNPELLLNKALAKLWKYSLINYDGEDYITLHRLVQTVLRHQYRKHVSYEWYSTILASMHANFVQNTDVLIDENRRQHLLPHAQSLIKYYDALWPNKLDLNEAEVLFDVGRVFLKQIRDPKSAKDYFEKCLTIYKYHYKNDHPKVATVLENLGRALGDLGDTEQNKELLIQALLIKNRHFGNDHIELASTLYGLGALYSRKGEAESALPLLEKALKIQEQHYGKDHITLTPVLVSLGNTFLCLGNPKLQKEYMERAVEIEEKHCGKNHPELSIALSNLGRAYCFLGDPQNAILFLKRALKIKEQHFGVDHWQTAYTRASLGIAYGELGEFNLQKELLENAIRIQKSHFGKQHPEVALTLTYLGHAYGDLGDCQQQLCSLKRSLEIQQRHYNKNNHELSRTLTYLGKAYNDLNQSQKAKELLLQALEIRENYYGKNHYEVAETLTYLGETYAKLGDTEQAKSSLERALNIRKQFYGANHPKVKNKLY